MADFPWKKVERTMLPKSPYGKSKVPRKLKDLKSFREEIVARRKVLVPAKSHMNMTAKALQKIEDGSELRAPMVERYLALIGHTATVSLKRGTQNLGELPIEKISEAAVLAAKSDGMPNRDIARQLGKSQDYFSLKETMPSLESAVEIFEFLGYEVKFRLYSHGITEEMEANLSEKRQKLGLRSAGARTATAQQTRAQKALESLFLDS